MFNGDSGRYGLESEAETMAVGRMLRDSGYLVWHTGWDTDANRPVGMELAFDLVRVA